MASYDGLVDLSLFSVSPTGDSTGDVDFPVPDRHEMTEPNTSPQIRISSWEELPPDWHPEFVRDKPLPPLPDERPVPYDYYAQHQGMPLPQSHFRRDKSYDDHCDDSKPAKKQKRSGFFLSRIKRSKSESTHAQNQKALKSSRPTPRLTLSVPQQAVRTVPSSPLLWVPGERVWLAHDPTTSQSQNAFRGEDGYWYQRLPSVPQTPTPQLVVTDDDDDDRSPPPSYSYHDFWRADPNDLNRSSTGSQWSAVATRLSRPHSTGH